MCAFQKCVYGGSLARLPAPFSRFARFKRLAHGFSCGGEYLQCHQLLLVDGASFACDFSQTTLYVGKVHGKRTAERIQLADRAVQSSTEIIVAKITIFLEQGDCFGRKWLSAIE